MNPDVEKLEKAVEENMELSRENNRMIKALYKNYRTVRVFRILYLVLIIGTALGAYYYLEPYLQQISELYTGSANTFNTLKDTLHALQF